VSSTHGGCHQNANVPLRRDPVGLNSNIADSVSGLRTHLTGSVALRSQRDSSAGGNRTGISLINNDTPSRSSASRKLPSPDQPIQLKNNVFRLHVHRYDLGITIKRKPKTDVEEEDLVTSALQRFFKIMLAADSTTVIPAFLNMDWSDRSYPD
jgi:hypothetical protein